MIKGVLALKIRLCRVGNCTIHSFKRLLEGTAVKLDIAEEGELSDEYVDSSFWK